jgi:hypothetical protein
MFDFNCRYRAGRMAGAAAITAAGVNDRYRYRTDPVAHFDCTVFAGIVTTAAFDRLEGEA